MTLDDTEIDMLLSALSALESQSAKDNIMGAMIGSMLARSKEEAKEQINKLKDEKSSEDKALKESILLLKSKLIHMRPSRMNLSAAQSVPEDGP